MSHNLTVHTSYGDLSELVKAFASRVDEDSIVLSAASWVAEGQPFRFLVTLRDGTRVLEGEGRCAGSLDNGAEAPPEERYDILVDSLQFTASSEVVYERILLARETAQARVETTVPFILLKRREGQGKGGEPAPFSLSGLEKAIQASRAQATRAQPRRPSRAPAPSSPRVTVPVPAPEVRTLTESPTTANDMSIRVPADYAKRAEALVPVLQAIGEYTTLGDYASRTSILRLALRIGLHALEAQYGDDHDK